MKQYKQTPLLSLCSIAFISIALLVGCQPAQESSESTKKQVTILGVVIGEQQKKLEQALAAFTEETGIEIVYEGTDTFATTLPIRVDSGNPPDLAMFPQPGLMKDFAKEGKLIPLTNFMTPQQLQDAYADSWLELGSVDDTVYGVWYRASVKSLVWYNSKVFKKNGYEIPKTWDEMIALSDRLVAEGKTPWCIGLESGDATGWVATDWVEDIMLRTAGAKTYDRWITHQIPFTDQSVKNALETFGKIVRNKNYVYGGMVGVLSTPFGDSIQGLFGDKPNCYLHRQATFIASFLPEDVNITEDVGIFPLPPINAEQGLPILVAGDVFAMFNDTPEARKLMEYLASKVPHEVAAGLGGYISPRKNISLTLYPDQLMKKQAQILADAEVIRFDASDMMPGAVGTGTFWSGMVDYVGGTDVDTVLQNIENSWPESTQ
ncbi:ABC transporter substrate-binding protein [Crocosphaera sp. UHCC 0190]|uniref:ABC transporter substrate-binding protein n=1 Tax=Crocosphaera sp. UHCC 0190 TaxID=3110246 RepID=UPI002B2188AD|nr:ABC transporter substrate-binding protein [Crocosphaera sp. UHCC 0190]MEA5512294.1 ABC transporter substrate-binding protein [Crocosphaera sp. UHCC 0190]